MKKLITVVLVLAALGIGGYYGFSYVYANYLGPPTVRMCHRMADLCELDGETADSCKARLKGYTKYFGKKAGENLFSCMEKAQSCIEIRGCEVGAGARGGMGGLFKGVMEGFSPGSGAEMDKAMKEVGESFDDLYGKAMSKETTDKAKKLEQKARDLAGKVDRAVHESLP